MQTKNERPLIEAIDVKKYFINKKKELHAVDGISFTIPEKHTLGVVGESGCGKSTLGRTILRLLEPTAGQLLYNGRDIYKAGRKEMKSLRSEMNIIFQDPYSSLDPRMTIVDSIMEPMLITKHCRNKREAYEKALQLMDFVGLAQRLEGAYPHELDGGRRQRVGIARTLSVDPKFIVCDEPVSALDVSIQAQILNLLMDLQEELGLTYLFITHDMSVVRHISQEIIVLYRGVCVEKAESDELFFNPLHPYTKALLASIPIPGIKGIDMEPPLLKGEVSSPINPEPGCRFAARCQYCTQSCTSGDIPLLEVKKGHFVACPKINLLPDKEYKGENQ